MQDLAVRLVPRSGTENAVAEARRRVLELDDLATTFLMLRDVLEQRLASVQSSIDEVDDPACERLQQRLDGIAARLERTRRLPVE